MVKSLGCTGARSGAVLCFTDPRASRSQPCFPNCDQQQGRDAQLDGKSNADNIVSPTLREVRRLGERIADSSTYFRAQRLKVFHETVQFPSVGAAKLLR